MEAIPNNHLGHKLYLEPQTTIYKWLFQLDDSKFLYKKWLFHQISIYKWSFGVPGSYYITGAGFQPSTLYGSWIPQLQTLPPETFTPHMTFDVRFLGRWCVFFHPRQFLKYKVIPTGGGGSDFWVKNHRPFQDFRTRLQFEVPSETQQKISLKWCQYRTPPQQKNDIYPQKRDHFNRRKHIVFQASCFRGCLGFWGEVSVVRFHFFLRTAKSHWGQGGWNRCRKSL